MNTELHRYRGELFKFILSPVSSDPLTHPIVLTQISDVVILGWCPHGFNFWTVENKGPIMGQGTISSPISH